MNRRLRQALALAGNLFVRPLSPLLPRDPLLWAFGAPGGRFEGNAKYLFLWLSLHPTQASPVWITENRALARRLRDRGLPALHRWSPKGLRAAARAGVYLVNDNGSDINFPLGGGARIFNLWHGVGLKNVNFGARVGRNAQLRASGDNFLRRIRNMRRFERSDWVLATSPEMARTFFSHCFKLPPSRLPPLGYPRLDPVVDDELKRLAASFEDYSVLDRPAGVAKSILYAPTLRLDGGDLLSAALPDLDRLSAALREQDAELLLKIHPKTTLHQNWRGSLPTNIRVLPGELDLYPVLDRFDAMVTDYSSLFFDWIHARSEGMALYPFDYARYTSTERDLAWDYDEATVGVRMNSFSELCEAIRTARVFDPLDPDKLALLRERFWGGEAGPRTASEKIAGFLLDQGGR